MRTKIGIYKDPRRKNPWIVRWHGEYDPAIGKQRFYSKGFRTKAMAEDFQAVKRNEFRGGRSRDALPVIKLSDFFREWLKIRKPELRAATSDLYKLTCTRLEKYFGKDKLLTSIKNKDAALFVAEQKNISNERKGQELSDWSREQIKRQAKTIFQSAVDWNLIAVNPFDKMPNVRLKPKRWHRITAKEYLALLDVVADNHRLRALYGLAYTAGLRLSELLSLTWDCIDFEASKVIVANRDGTDKLPPFYVKDHEKRSIPLPEHTMKLLLNWHEKAPIEVPFVFLTEDRFSKVRAKWAVCKASKKPWSNRQLSNNVLRNFKKHCQKAGIKPIGKLTVHTLRKSAGQNWADNLPMAVTKELMGHADVKTTMEFYNQVDAVHEQMAVDAITAMIEKANEQQEVSPVAPKVAHEAKSLENRA